MHRGILPEAAERQVVQIGFQSFFLEYQSSSRARAICSPAPGMTLASCQASVGNSRFLLLRVESDRKKNVATTLSRPHVRAISCAMADLPTPAGPCSQRIFSAVSGLSTQSRICFRMASRVPGWHRRSGSWADESWRALKETNCFSSSKPVLLK
jgi:hypothetical protein